MPDHLGSTSIVVDSATSEVVERGTYRASGGADSDYRPTRWDSFREDYRFTGKEEDVAIGVQYFGRRYLSSALGRWTSPDPLSVHTLGAYANLYSYVNGWLFRAVDPVGLKDAPAACGSAADCNKLYASAGHPGLGSGGTAGPTTSAGTSASPQPPSGPVTSAAPGSSSTSTGTPNAPGLSAETLPPSPGFENGGTNAPGLGEGGTGTPGLGHNGAGQNSQGHEENVGTKEGPGIFNWLDAAMTIWGGAARAGTGGDHGIPGGSPEISQESVAGQVLFEIGQLIIDYLTAKFVQRLAAGPPSKPAAEGGGIGTSPTINPADVAGKTPQEIDQIAQNAGLTPKGPDPMGGKGAYVDPVTGEQRVLIHPDPANPRAHVNDPGGNRLGPGGQVVPPESPDAHLPIRGVP